MVKKPDKPATATGSQLDKFKETARTVETDDSEERFDRVVKGVAKAASDEYAKKKAFAATLPKRRS